MLSICIPVYNVEIEELVSELIHQCKQNGILVEILVYDDGSDLSFKTKNQPISRYTEVKYFELKKNLGSAAIRNKMANDAVFENLLFLDSDSGLSKNYIAVYAPFFHTDYQIVNGGRIHPPTLPGRNKSLRWKVGKLKEDYDVEKRRKIPNKSFMSNNFLVKKALFNTINFDESILRSGHEDTMFGIELERKGIEINHINNPVIHLGLEDNDVFVRKTRQRLETLFILEELNRHNELFYERITIIRYFQKVKMYHLTSIFNLLYRMFGKFMEKMLYLPNPSMLIYDIYKIAYYSSLVKSNNHES